jgi:hypothetical protein
MSWIFLLGVVVAAVPMLAFALWFAGPIDEVFNWLTNDTDLALNSKESPDAGFGVVAR